MGDEKEIEKAFMKDFQNLLDKYKAEINIDDHWTGYPECGQDIKAIVNIDAVYDDNHDIIQDYIEFELGNFHMHEK